MVLVEELNIYSNPDCCMIPSDKSSWSDIQVFASLGEVDVRD